MQALNSWMLYSAGFHGWTEQGEKQTGNEDEDGRISRYLRMASPSLSRTAVYARVSSCRFCKDITANALKFPVVNSTITRLQNQIGRDKQAVPNCFLSFAIIV